MTRVVAPVGGDIGESRAEKTGNYKGERELPERLHVDVGAVQTTPGVEVTDVGRDGQSEAIGVKDERTEVKRSRYAGHG